MVKNIPTDLYALNNLEVLRTLAVSQLNPRLTLLWSD